jgi:hypothetical protein
MVQLTLALKSEALTLVIVVCIAVLVFYKSRQEKETTPHVHEAATEPESEPAEELQAKILSVRRRLGVRSGCSDEELRSAYLRLIVNLPRQIPRVRQGGDELVQHSHQRSY